MPKHGVAARNTTTEHFMSDLISQAFWFIITIGILVTVHEWGHFIVARWCGVHVERFSVGFGKALFSRIGKNGTQYQIAAIPLGGYVKMLDEREQAVAPEMQAFAFNRQSVAKRFAIVLAGPMANLILCIAFLWAALSLGSQELRPLLGKPEGLAQAAGFESGDEIQAIGSMPVQTWNDALPTIAIAAMDRRAISVRVLTASGETQNRLLALDQLKIDYQQDRLLQEIGMTPYFAAPDALIGQVVAGGPADGVLQPGDRIVSIEGQAVVDFAGIAAALAKHSSANNNVNVEIQRNGQTMRILLAPTAQVLEGKTVWRIGVASLAATKNVRYPISQALPLAVQKTGRMASDSLAVIKRLLTGAASVDNLSGPIGIAKAADSQASWGLSSFLSFLAAISLALCIMNLLPIPMLDGGHLLFLGWEAIAGRPVSESLQVAGQSIGLFLLLGLMGIAIFNDFFRIIS
jgi:regulator of sigma E protease